MDFKVGNIVSVRHFSGSNLMQGVVSDSKYDIVTIDVTENISELKLDIGDPVVVGFEANSMVYISSCNVLDYSTSNSRIKLKSDTIEALANKRLHERFPVSFNASIRIGSSKTEYSSVIKNISFSGMLACSKHEFPLYQELKFDFDLGSTVTLKAIIIRKTKESNHFEYGLKIVYTDPHAPNIVKRFLAQIKKDQEEYLSKIKNNIAPSKS